MGKKKRQFIVDENGFINVYVDGSCLLLDRFSSASGYGIYFGPKNTCKVYGPCKRRATNNVAEIQSAYIAILLARQLGVTKLCVNTDSKNVYDAATYLIDEWKENDWLSLYTSQPIVDRPYYEKLKKSICDNPQMEIKFVHIDGHSGNQYHNAADRLARKGAEQHCNYGKVALLNIN
ncbi:hypothetical protein HA402_004696 [Bradysia odoriphaga]|nr:hypothetical protein HA402_004696 [Bradysia odoriphaga]